MAKQTQAQTPEQEAVAREQSRLRMIRYRQRMKADAERTKAVQDASKERYAKNREQDIEGVREKERIAKAKTRARQAASESLLLLKKSK